MGDVGSSINDLAAVALTVLQTLWARRRPL
jgi:hypothetical protein